MAFIAVFVAALMISPAAGATLSASPMAKIVQLITNMKNDIEKEGKGEQASYDKYSCWVEDTLRRKASDISKATELIGELADSIVKLKAMLGSHGAEIANLKKNIAENTEDTREASGVRSKENGDYQRKRGESEHCIAALEGAIKALTGAGTKKAGFLQQAKFLSVVGGLGQVLDIAQAQSKLSLDQLDVVRRFVQHPEADVQHGLIAAQTGQNPFGDYAPASDQIQGLFKGMYDGFTADLEKDNVEEATSQKSFEELMASKAQELKTLKSTLQRQETDQATKTKKLSEANILRDATTDQLAADKTYFEDTKEAAESKAIDWSTRMRLRTEELAGIEGAIKILSGGSKTFKEAGTGFTQLTSVTKHSQSHQVYIQLKKLASKYQSTSLKRVQLMAKSAGHFDAVMQKIDSMVALCRQEEQDDIKHRDRCENKMNANGNDIDDAKAGIDKTKKKLKRMANADDELREALAENAKQIKSTNSDMKELSDLRNKDHSDFKRALKMDRESVQLIGQATATISKFYKANSIALKLIQAPKYSKDSSKPPKTEFNKASEHQGESTNIVGMLDMMQEDFRKEMKEGRADEAKEQAEYEKQRDALQDTLETQTETRVSMERERASLQEKMSGAKKVKKEFKDDLAGAKDMQKSLGSDCKWVKTHFETRRKKRKAEMEGLVEARDFLAGVEQGKAVLAPSED